MWVPSLGWEDPMEEEMAPLSSILVWKIPWTKEPSGLQSMGSQRVRLYTVNGVTKNQTLLSNWAQRWTSQLKKKNLKIPYLKFSPVPLSGSTALYPRSSVPVGRQSSLWITFTGGWHSGPSGMFITLTVTVVVHIAVVVFEFTALANCASLSTPIFRTTWRLTS